MEQPRPALTGTGHVLTIYRDGLPPLLLAAVHHPDAAVRGRLRLALDGLIAARRPLVGEVEVRHRLARAGPLALGPAGLELAGLVARLVFSAATTRPHRLWFNVVESIHAEKREGVTLACAPLRVVAPKRRRPDVRLVLDGAWERVGASDFWPSPVRVVCRAAAGFALDVAGTTDWGLRRVAGRLLAEALFTSGPALSDLGLAVEPTPAGVRITTPTPEAILRFSACLARGEVFRLRFTSNDRTETNLFVQTRDFDGDEAEFPAVAFPAEGGPPWLTGLPPVALTLPLDDLLPVVYWPTEEARSP